MLEFFNLGQVTTLQTNKRPRFCHHGICPKKNVFLDIVQFFAILHDQQCGNVEQRA